MKLSIQSLTDPNDKGHLLQPERANLTGLDMHPRFSPEREVDLANGGGYVSQFLGNPFREPDTSCVLQLPSIKFASA